VLLALLQYQRESLVRKVTGVSEQEARRRFVGSATTLLWLITHMTRAEATWVLRRFAGEAAEPPADEPGPHETVAGAVEAYRRMWQTVDAVVEGAGLDAPCADVGDEAAVNLRWVLAHLLEETARHAGHADILRELVDGTTGR
jgi:uncharacterized damage-inducible protein DinB